VKPGRPFFFRFGFVWEKHIASYVVWRTRWSWWMDVWFYTFCGGLYELSLSFGSVLSDQLSFHDSRGEMSIWERKGILG
jgi:hypothetical protein